MTQTSLPKADTPLYSHPLPQIEQWLREQGCEQDPEELDLWHLKHPQWRAELRLDVEELAVVYTGVENSAQTVRRTFKYSFSRRDIEDAVFSGP
jgi:hypothetical protein